MNSILIVVLAFMALQSLASLLQVKYYQNFIKKIAATYNGQSGYEFYTDVSKGFLMKTVVAVVLNAEGEIVSCHICRGFTIFAKFKEAIDFKGITLTDIRQKELANQRLTQAELTLNKIYSRKLQMSS